MRVVLVKTLKSSIERLWKKNLQFFFENLWKHFMNDCQAKFDTARSQNVGVMGKIVSMPQNWWQQKILKNRAKIYEKNLSIVSNAYKLYVLWWSWSKFKSGDVMFLARWFHMELPFWSLSSKVTSNFLVKAWNRRLKWKFESSFYVEI